MNAPEEVAVLAQAKAGKLFHIVLIFVFQILGEFDAGHYGQRFCLGLVAAGGGAHVQPVHQVLVGLAVKGGRSVAPGSLDHRRVGTVAVLAVAAFHLDADVQALLLQQVARAVVLARIGDFIIVNTVDQLGLRGVLDILVYRLEGRLAVLEQPAAHRIHGRCLPVPFARLGALLVVAKEYPQVVVQLVGALQALFQLLVVGVDHQEQVKVVLRRGNLHAQDGTVGSVIAPQVVLVPLGHAVVGGEGAACTGFLGEEVVFFGKVHVLLLAGGEGGRNDECGKTQKFEMLFHELIKLWLLF